VFKLFFFKKNCSCCVCCAALPVWPSFVNGSRVVPAMVVSNHANAAFSWNSIATNTIEHFSFLLISRFSILILMSMSIPFSLLVSHFFSFFNSQFSIIMSMSLPAGRRDNHLQGSVRAPGVSAFVSFDAPTRNAISLDSFVASVNG